jgi:hypothetical protein
LKLLAASKRISAAYKKTSISKISEPVCMWIPTICILVGDIVDSSLNIIILVQSIRPATLNTQKKE